MGSFEDKLKGNWNIIKGKLRKEYGELTEDDLQYTKGQEDELLGRIQRRTGKTKEELKSYIDNVV
jgi:uncharacterized protein YjbJ (UPF0337 family)